MSRPRRYITDNGKVFCRACQRWRHLSQYRTREVIPNLTELKDIWFEENGTLYGKPDGYCKACANKKTQGPIAFSAYLGKLGVEAYADRLEGKPPEGSETGIVYEVVRVGPPTPELLDKYKENPDYVPERPTRIDPVKEQAMRDLDRLMEGRSTSDTEPLPDRD